jgi:hypothetical protein
MVAAMMYFIIARNSASLLTTGTKMPWSTRSRSWLAVFFTSGGCSGVAENHLVLLVGTDEDGYGLIC